MSRKNSLFYIFYLCLQPPKAIFFFLLLIFLPSEDKFFFVGLVDIILHKNCTHNLGGFVACDGNRFRKQFMKNKRRDHCEQFKAKVFLAATKGDRTMAELAGEFDVHPNKIA